MHYDVFNGDADGILALLQLRLADPKDSKFITGVKRDISLLRQVDAQAATSVTTLDISMEKNIEALEKLLAAKVPVFYVDHHRSGDIPASEHLNAVIDTDPNTCTSLLVNNHLQGKYAHWAVTAAFGDNMNKAATDLGKSLNLTDEELGNLQNLGIYINYNGYGATVDDLHYKPAELFKLLLAYPNPLDLINEPGSLFEKLALAYNQDMDNASNAEVLADNDAAKVVQLPNEAWARRVSGVFGNELANQSPDKAHAVITSNVKGGYTVSVRAPLNNKQGADKVCIQFETGGGRAGAAGVNQLSEAELSRFIETLTDYYTN